MREATSNSEGLETDGVKLLAQTPPAICNPGRYQVPKVMGFILGHFHPGPTLGMERCRTRSRRDAIGWRSRSFSTGAWEQQNGRPLMKMKTNQSFNVGNSDSTFISPSWFDG
mmetsp:Transcript_4516/g.7043  ORF Transcript_4516/g.7043 Transcript_4516/m.7043 type:complete len:112 (+) Transcript_4516:814-1149(+)